MAQGVLPFQYEVEKTASGMTALAGLPLLLDLATVAQLRQSIERHVRLRPNQGYTDCDHVLSLVLLNIAGGDRLEDLKRLAADEAIARVLQRVRCHGLDRPQRRELEKRWRKHPEQMVVSPYACGRYLQEFHDAKQESQRQVHEAFIPKPKPQLMGLGQVNADLVAFAQHNAVEPVATLDMDATLIPTHKHDALCCYKHYPAYQPLNVFWSQQQLLLHSQFRDGNVPAGCRQLEVLVQALDYLPPQVQKVQLRTDTAGYVWDLLHYCAKGRNERFGVIDYAVGVDVTPAFKAAVAEVKPDGWQRFYAERDGERIWTEQQFAEVCYVPNEAARTKHDGIYRFIAIRERLPQLELPGAEADPEQLPFPTMDWGPAQRYKLFGLVTNRPEPADQLIRWHRQRCGKSEEVHAVLKNDLAGGTMPCGTFGANAAWWAIVIIAFNLVTIMKRLVLGGSWANRRLKAIRYGLINLAGRVLKHARRLILRLEGEHPAIETLVAARQRIMAMATGPPP